MLSNESKTLSCLNGRSCRLHIPRLISEYNPLPHYEQRPEPLVFKLSKYSLCCLLSLLPGTFSPQVVTQTQSISFKSLVTYHIVIKHYYGHWSVSIHLCTVNLKFRVLLPSDGLSVSIHLSLQSKFPLFTEHLFCSQLELQNTNYSLNILNNTPVRKRTSTGNGIFSTSPHWMLESAIIATIFLSILEWQHSQKSLH